MYSIGVLFTLNNNGSLVVKKKLDTFFFVEENMP